MKQTFFLTISILSNKRQDTFNVRSQESNLYLLECIWVHYTIVSSAITGYIRVMQCVIYFNIISWEHSCLGVTIALHLLCSPLFILNKISKVSYQHEAKTKVNVCE